MGCTVGDLIAALKTAWEANGTLATVPVFREEEPPHTTSSFPYVVVKIREGGLRSVTNNSWMRQVILQFTVYHRTPELVETTMGSMRDLLDGTLPSLATGKGHILRVRCTGENHGQDDTQVYWGRLVYDYMRREPR